ncbi:hypothetical protein D917_01579 [Trichinella nativa]|uniref:Uncharacterized protein n=1 Tax=Trichinella nativa TaxID=6335 RepID=A0A1Y3ESU6_9BILA|nr:hypothetical protein D917_01579 [Trichinella nativa]
MEFSAMYTSGRRPDYCGPENSTAPRKFLTALPVSGCGQRRKRRTGAILVLISPAVGAVVGMIDRRHGRKRKKRTPRFVTVHRNDPRERYCSHSVKCVVRNSA